MEQAIPVLSTTDLSLMDKDYIFNHQLKIHNFDSFARALLYEVLEIAKTKAAEEPCEKISFNINVRVEAWGPQRCNKVKIGSNWIEIHN